MKVKVIDIDKLSKEHAGIVGFNDTFISKDDHNQKKEFNKIDVIIHNQCVLNQKLKKILKKITIK